MNEWVLGIFEGIWILSERENSNRQTKMLMVNSIRKKWERRWGDKKDEEREV